MGGFIRETGTGLVGPASEFVLQYSIFVWRCAFLMCVYYYLISTSRVFLILYFPFFSLQGISASFLCGVPPLSGTGVAVRIGTVPCNWTKLSAMDLYI